MQVVTLALKVLFFELEEAERAQKTLAPGEKLFTWKTIGRNNWLEEGIHRTDALGLVLWPTAKYIELEPDRISSDEDSGQAIVVHVRKGMVERVESDYEAPPKVIVVDHDTRNPSEPEITEADVEVEGATAEFYEIMQRIWEKEEEEEEEEGEEEETNGHNNI